jgi:L-threonylcarbamoyladenylate synthase
VPSHPITREILKSGLMLAMPSANISGSLSPTKAEHVKKYFPDAFLVDGGTSEVGLESTIVTFDENDDVIILREGVLQIEGAKCSDEKIIAPGMLLKHYAPNNLISINVLEPSATATFIGFGNVRCDYNLSADANLQEAAANLFSILHEADSKNKKIEVAPIPNIGIGAAINDKLTRAASQNEKKHKI